MNRQRILIVDDELTLRLSLQLGLEDLGYEVKSVETIHEANLIMLQFLPKIIFLDIRLPDGNGLSFLEQIKNEYPDIAVVIMSAYGDTKSTVQAIKLGAIDYINKPFEFEEIQLLVNKTFEQLNIQTKIELYDQEKKNQKVSFIGNNEATNVFLRQLEQVAMVRDATVLIRGETGTGKELAASHIQHMSDRKDQPFMAVNCGALPINLIESELFGHEKGAFTGALHMKKGLFEWADGGTLFLDEIGEFTPEMQVKLLRFLEDRKFKRVGGSRDIHVDVRVITATHRDLEQMIRDNSFRSDLFYRLNVVPITLPPLCQRGEDIILLAEYFLEKHCYQLGRQPLQLSEEVKQLLLHYSWPGNIRELKNIMERFSILHRGQFVRLEHLPKEMIKLKKEGDGQTLTHSEIFTERENHPTELQLNDENISLELIIENIEKKYLHFALQKTRWNVSEASELLGLSRYAMQRRVEKYFPK